MAFDQAQQREGPPAGSSGGGKAQEIAGQAKEQVQETAEQVKGKASGRVREQLDSRSTALGEQVGSFGGALRKAGEHLRAEGNESGAKAAHRAADQVERLGGYLTGSGSDRFLGDLEDFGRRRPWAAAAVGAALGFVGARFVKASSESRYDASSHARRDADLPLSRDGEMTAPVTTPPLAGVPPYGSL